MKITYEQLQNAADNGGNFIEDLANGAKGAVCKQYRNYKDWYHQNIDLLSPPGALLQQFWDGVCPLEPPYTPPLLPPGSDNFTGGQCDCVSYIVYAEVYSPDTNQWYGLNPTNWWGAIEGITIFKPDWSEYNIVFLICKGLVSSNPTCPLESDYHPFYNTFNVYTKARITSVVRTDGLPDTCGNPPISNPPPLAPPNQINDVVPVGEGDNLIDVPITINPQIQLPGVNVNVFAPIFKPNFDLNLNPQFNIKPNINITPTINFNFGADGVDVGIAKPGGDNDDSFNIELGDNINNIVNNVNNVNNTINQIKDKLACDPCEKLEDIKKILEYQPTYKSASTGEFQSITRDNLFSLGYLEIEITQLPNTNKIVFGGNSDNSMYTGWLFWRMNGYNFEKVQITSEKSVYWSPKWANGFGITCTHNSRANCYYYIEQKD